jgi:hypothetical protein
MLWSVNAEKDLGHIRIDATDMTEFLCDQMGVVPLDVCSLGLCISGLNCECQLRALDVLE